MTPGSIGYLVELDAATSHYHRLDTMVVLAAPADWPAEPTVEWRRLRAGGTDHDIRQLGDLPIPDYERAYDLYATILELDQTLRGSLTIRARWTADRSLHETVRSLLTRLVPTLPEKTPLTRAQLVGCPVGVWHGAGGPFEPERATVPAPPTADSLPTPASSVVTLPPSV